MKQEAFKYDEIRNDSNQTKNGIFISQKNNLTINNTQEFVIGLPFEEGQVIKLQTIQINFDTESVNITGLAYLLNSVPLGD